MSIRQVLHTVGGLLKDEQLGLARAIDLLAHTAECDPAKIRTDLNFVKWKLSGAGTMQPARAPNVMLRPNEWVADLDQSIVKDALAEIEIGYECFAADPDELQENTAIAATALAKVLRSVREYSDANGGTIITIEGPIRYRAGEFVGPVTGGFLAQVTFSERGTE